GDDSCIFDRARARGWVRWSGAGGAARARGTRTDAADPRSAQPQSLRGGGEPRALQCVAERGADRELAVDPLDAQPPAGRPHGGREGGGGRLDRRLRIRVEEVQYRLAALLDVEAQLPVDEHDEGARLASRTVRGGALGPAERGAVGRSEEHTSELQ